jgi:hypothetical protein
MVVNTHRQLRGNLNKITWSSVLVEKLTVAQLVRKYSAFDETQKFITVFTKILS